jgi:hypothetical protein
MAIEIATSIIPLLNTAAKRRSVSGVIGTFAVGHQAADVGIGIIGWFVPAGGLFAMAASIGIQAPLVYQPLAREIGKVYLAKPDGQVGELIDDAAIEGAIADLVASFGTEFLTEIAMELLHEAGIGAGLSILPIVGNLIGMALDAKIAATMTWRVGIATAIYFENGCQWIGDRRTTYEAARRLCRPLSANPTDRYDFTHLGREVPEMNPRRKTLLERYWNLCWQTTGVDQMWSILVEEHHVDNDLVEALLRDIRGRRVDEGRPSAAAVSRSVDDYAAELVAKARAFVKGMRAVGMSTSEILKQGTEHGLDEQLLELLMRAAEA